MANIVKKQHYVYKHYLQQWVKDNKICCLRKNKDILYVNPENIAQERYFYRLNKFSEEDLILAMKIVDEFYSDKVLRVYNEINTYLKHVPDFDEELANNVTDFVKDCEEKFFNCPPEIDLRDFLNEAYNKNLGQLTNEDKKMKICYALGEQYCRTNKVRSSFVENNIFKDQNIALENVWFLIRHYIAIKIGMALYYKNYRFCLLEDPNGNFITGDQPIINTYANYKNINPEKFELFYPISPNLALLITEDDTFEDLSVNVIDDSLVEHFNERIANCSHEQLFAMDERKLLKYKK